MTKIIFSNRKEINWGHYGKEFQTLQNGKIRVRPEKPEGNLVTQDIILDSEGNKTVGNVCHTENLFP